MTGGREGQRVRAAIGGSWRLTRQGGAPSVRVGQDAEIGIGNQESLDLIDVFFRQHRARDVNQPPARLHGLDSLSQNLALFFLTLRQIRGLQTPLGIGAPPPCARAGAGRIDQHDIKARTEFVERGYFPGAQNLNIAHARPLDAQENGFQARAVIIVSVNLAGVLHHRRHGQRLAAAACTQIKHLRAWPSARQRRRDLAAFVLNFTPASLIGGLSLQIGNALITRGCRNADGVRRHLKFYRAVADQRLHDFFARGFECVDAQISGRAFR